MKKIILIITMLSVVFGISQNEDNYWYFGENAGMRFNTSPPTVLSDGALNSLEGCSSMSNSIGQLLFYSDGETVWDANHNVMPNGTGLSGNTSSSQSIIIIKDKQIPNIYFIVTNTSLGAKYSLIDMNLNNGLGDIFPGRKNLAISASNSEAMTYISRDSTTDWLILFDQGTYKSYSMSGGIINTQGILSPIVETQNLTDNRSIMKISPDGRWIYHSAIGNSGVAFVSRFNRMTGRVDYVVPLTGPGIWNRFLGGEFSPNGNLLYVNANEIDTRNGCGTANSKRIFQYNLNGTAGWNNNPEVLGANMQNGGRGQLQLAPNGKIYVARICEPWLGVINNPNIIGVNANYIDNGIALDTGTLSREGLPNITTAPYFEAENIISGFTRFDFDTNGCDINDSTYNNLLLKIEKPNFSALEFTTDNGQFSRNLQNGQYTITPNPENPSYWNFSPASATVNFPAQASPVTQDFCVTANGSVEDLEVLVLPLEQARPGFDTDYVVKIKNKGNITTSGTVTLDYENNFMTLSSSNPTAGQPATNQLSWSFTGLQPFQMEAYEFTMTLNTPTATVNPLNGGDILTFTGVVTGTGVDAMPADNTMIFDQTVVNSYDPNDKRCLEGETIEPSDVGEYVHYMIRFENTGTASAVNVVIKDEIDLTQFDINTLVPLGGSHDYYTRIREGNVVEFIHENINLDFNDATNDGHVVFKIKTLNTLTAGDSFDNTAEIFFDFNAPIITNNEVTTVQSTASLGEATDTSISLYPNPTSGIINLTANNAIEKAVLIDVNGRIVSQRNFTGGLPEQAIDLSALTSGVYFMNITTSMGTKMEKVVVE